MRITIATVLLAITAGCTTLSVGPEEESLCGPRPSEAQARDAVQVYIDRVGLKDPSSAQVRDVRVADSAKWYKGLINGGGYNYGWEISFQLNAKNSFGAYIGFKDRKVLLAPGGMVQWRMEVE